MLTLKRYLIVFFIFLVSLQSYAQQTVKEATKNKDFVIATKLYDNQKYAAAQKTFISVIEHTSDNLLVEESKFYIAVCAVRLFNSDALGLLIDFIEKYPESARISQANFELGNYYLREEKYDKAIETYEKVSMRSFSNQDVAEYFYKSAYSYYKTNQYSKAKPLFREVKDSKSVYAENSLFYYSYLEYVDKNYPVALPGFEFLADSSMFANVVPPYICQIYYVYGEYDKLIQYARKIEGVVNPAQVGDVYRVLAGAYYKTLQYDKALPYYEKYFGKAKNPSKSDYYELGYLYYRAGKYEKATKFFQFVTSENDTIASSAYYHLGDCYLKIGEKEKARNAFRAAMDYDIFPKQKEDATFIHAKLIYELSYAPFNEAITAMQAFIANYPNSEYQDEANSLLVKIFMSSKNYKDALASLEQISFYTTDLKIAYQEIAYYRALELFNNHDYAEAVKMFDKSLHYGIFNKVIKSYSNYWKAEAYYKLEDYEQARNLFKEYVITPGTFNTVEYKRAHYNIGYTYFEQKMYSDAVVWYRKFLDISDDIKTTYYSDAANRTGDCYFILQDFGQASKYYEKSVKSGMYDIDYALYQQAFCDGLEGKHASKIKLLSLFLKTYPSSPYYDDALFEQAEAYVKVGSYNKAIANYDVIIKNYRAGTYIKKALLQVAKIVYDTKDFDKALPMYERVVEEYPGSEEAQTAVSMIENIYRNKSDMNGFASYIQSLGGHANYPEVKIDSLTFEVAEEKYLDGDCESAQPLLTSYIQKFGEGFFVLKAHYYKAECFFDNGYEYEALQDYEFVIHQTPNEYTEHALTRAAYICLEAKQYEKALEFLIPLEQDAANKMNLLFSRYGLVKAYLELKEYKKLVEIGETYVVNEKLTPDEKRWANVQLAHAYDSLHDTTQALIKYRTLAIEYTTPEGSEAKYRIAQYLYDQGKYDECEQEITDFLDKNSPHQYWLGKVYVLWAKVFIERNELFQAKYTLQNVLEHYKNKEDGIIAEVNDLLDYITDLEIEASSQVEEPVVIPMGNEENQELFENTDEQNQEQEIEQETQPEK